MAGQHDRDGQKTSGELIFGMLHRLSNDPRVNVWHVGICMAVAHLSHSREGLNPVAVTRHMVMRSAHIGSVATYHKCIRQLQEYGYIRYEPSYSYYSRTTMELLWTGG